MPGRGRPGRHLHPQPHLHRHHRPAAATDSYPASPGGGALPAETVTARLRDRLRPARRPWAAPGRLRPGHHLRPPSARSPRRTSARPRNNAYVTNTYDPHTGAADRHPGRRTPPSPPPRTTTPPTPTTRPGTSPPQTDTRNGDRQSETQCYDYDTLDQLTQAWTATDNCAATPQQQRRHRRRPHHRAALLDQLDLQRPRRATSQTQHSLTGGTEHHHQLHLQRQRHQPARTR